MTLLIMGTVTAFLQTIGPLIQQAVFLPIFITLVLVLPEIPFLSLAVAIRRLVFEEEQCLSGKCH